MSYLEEFLSEFRKGAKIRRKSWIHNDYIYLENDDILDRFEMIFDLSVSDIKADDWELYQEKSIDWDYIIKNKCLCWFWDDDEKFGRYGRLIEIIKEEFITKNDEGYSIQYENCRPVCKDEITFYEDKEDKQEKSFYTIGSYDPRYGIYAGICTGKHIWVRMQDAPKEMDWDGANKYCEELDVVLGWHLPTKEELMLIYANKDTINKTLEEHGGEPMKNEWYWSSSDYSAYVAWGQYFDVGYITTNGKGINRYFRPVLTL